VATNDTNTTELTPCSANSSSFSSNQVMCLFKGNLDEDDSTLVNLNASALPKECDVIIYSRFSVNKYSIIDVDDALLKSITDLNKPVIVTLKRDNGYPDWSNILTPDGNDNETKILCDFASSHNVTGYVLYSIAPGSRFYGLNETVGKYIIPYIKQLKKCGLVIGVSVYPAPSSMKNPCVYNYDELNSIVDFYEIQTFALNSCNPNIYNGRSPISTSEHGPNYCYGMDEVVSYLNETKISFTKVVFDIEMYPINNNSTTYSSYAQVCSGTFDNSSWCVQTSMDFYNKGKFAHDLNVGIIVAIMDLDDVNNDCGCTKPFNGFENVYAGFTDNSTSPCKNFDVQSLEYSIQ